MLLDKDTILDSKDLPYDDLEVPEWGGTVRVRHLTVGEKEEIEIRARKSEQTPDAQGWRGLRPLVVAYALINDDGSQMFTTAEARELSKKSSVPIERIFDHVLETNGLSKKSAAELSGN